MSEESRRPQEPRHPEEGGRPGNREALLGSGGAPRGQALVELRQVTKKFGADTVFADIDLTVGAGDVVVLIGPSGAGKSTLLRCVNGLEKVTSGEIHVAGEALTYDQKSINHIRSRIGMVFQQFNLFPHMTVTRNITMAQRDVLGRSEGEARDRALTLLDRVGLKNKADVYPESLSGGQQQRVAIARALAMDPAVMLFDEPTSALDPELVGEVLAVMRDLADEGMTMMLVTHEMRFARRAAHRIVLMADQRIAEEGPPEQVLDNPTTDRARAFLSELTHEGGGG